MEKEFSFPCVSVRALSLFTNVVTVADEPVLMLLEDVLACLYLRKDMYSSPQEFLTDSIQRDVFLFHFNTLVFSHQNICTTYRL